MDNKNEKNIEIINDKTILDESPINELKKVQGPGTNYKRKNAIYIGIILICIVGIVLFLMVFKQKQKLEIPPKIVDRTGEYCAEALKFFYTDENYKYYFSCMKNYYVLYDGKEYTIEDALNNKIIEISDLNKNNITYYKEQIIK